MASYCPTHGLAIEPSLGYCVRCLTREVDPPDTEEASWWWRNWNTCHCRAPSYATWYRSPFCLKCRQAIVRDRNPALVSRHVPQGERRLVLDRELKTA